MDEHQNNMETGSQDEGAGSGAGKPKVMRAGGEAKSNRQAPRGNGSSEEKASERADAAEVSPAILRAGQQAVKSAGAATETAARVSERMDECIGGGEALSEWTSFARRAYHRNTQAMAELRGCYTLFHLLQWQTNLLNATVSDWVETNARILQQVTHKNYAAM
jgi:hypothetical protein